MHASYKIELPVWSHFPVLMQCLMQCPSAFHLIIEFNIKKSRSCIWLNKIIARFGRNIVDTNKKKIQIFFFC